MAWPSTIELGNNVSSQFVIAFRGDNRDPKQIFVSGFTPLQGKGPVTYRKGPKLSGNITQVKQLKPGDIEPSTAVTFSRRLTAAVMFPLDTSVLKTYVYGVAVELGDLYNTHFKQVMDGLKGMKKWSGMGNQIDAETAKTLMWPLFAQEMAAIQIPSTDIFAAVACQRQWRGSDWKSGLDYTLEVEVFRNPQCALPTELKHTFDTFVEEGLPKLRSGSSAAMESGYSLSNRK